MPRKHISLAWLTQAIKSHNSDECLIWPFGKNASGYGQIYFNKSPCLSHRVAFYLANGHWPEPCGMHTCDTPACVNPGHIIAGTKAENSLDAKAKGRFRPLSGERVHTAKLNPELVRKIREEYIYGSTGSTGSLALSIKYGISRNSLFSVVNRKHWRHVQ